MNRMFVFSDDSMTIVFFVFLKKSVSVFYRIFIGETFIFEADISE